MSVPSARNRIVNLETGRAGHLSHPSLKGLSDQDVRAWLSDLPIERFAAAHFANGPARPRVQPRGGFPLFEKQRRLSIALSEAGADFIPLTIDSHTRLNDYERAALILEESEANDADLLNGYPLVAHGWQLTRALYDGIEKPVSLRHGTADARVLVEHALASGITEIEGGALCYTLPYNSRYPLDRAVLHWQLIDRICADLSTPEREIHRESFGPLTATMVPPVIVAAVQLCELLLAAEQGVGSFTVSFGQTGSFCQDAALARVLRNQSKKLLERFEFGHVKVYLAYHQWMGPFPMNRDAADDLIAAGAAAAMAISADKIITKTRDEAFGIPTIESNARAVSQVRRILSAFDVRQPLSNADIDEEAEHLEFMVEAAMEAIFSLSATTFVATVLQAVRAGLLDVPFAPHRANANQLLCLRDADGGIRISLPGNLPVPESCLQREHAKIAERQDFDAPAYEKLFRDITKYSATDGRVAG